jgi:hypothetical protein
VGEERGVEESGGEEREGKEMDGCPLTISVLLAHSTHSLLSVIIFLRLIDGIFHIGVVFCASQSIGHVVKCSLGRVLVSHIHPPICMRLTMASTNCQPHASKSSTSVIWVSGIDFMSSRIVALVLRRNTVILECDWWMMEVLEEL